MLPLNLSSVFTTSCCSVPKKYQIKFLFEYGREMRITGVIYTLPKFYLKKIHKKEGEKNRGKREVESATTSYRDTG